jgi:hypothetical protein
LHLRKFRIICSKFASIKPINRFVMGLV